jgi:hypothetical protein
MSGCLLIYVSRYGRPDPVPDYAQLRPDRLLIAPVFVNQLGFTKGYLEVVGNRTVTAADGVLTATPRRLAES